MDNRAIVTAIDAGAYWRVVVGRGKGNILDRATLIALAGVFREARHTPALKAVTLEGAGEHFSYGASIHEHLPERVEDLLAASRELVDAMLDSDVVTIAVVRGQCLGGGLEVAALCHRVVAAGHATFGQPEISLGVFAPLASIVLPERIGRARAEDLCLTGRAIGAEEARAIGLVDELAPGDPWEAALAWMRRHFDPLSASSLGLAAKAIRLGWAARIRQELPALERLYLSELMRTADAVEGLRAFIEKRRPPLWVNR